MNHLQPIIDDVNTKAARALEAVQAYAEACVKVAQAVKASLEVVAKWGEK